MFDERHLSQFPALHGSLVRAAQRLLGARADAEDVVQDAYLRALETGDRPAPDAAQAWLTTVMRHLAIDRLRREGWLRRWIEGAQAQERGASSAASAEALASRSEETGRALRLLVQRLGAADGALLLLREVFEASFREIAEASGKTEEGCRQQLHRALLRLRRREEASPFPLARHPADEEDTFHLFHQALREADVRILFAMLRQPPLQAHVHVHVHANVHARPAAALEKIAAPRAACQVVQAGGRLGLALTLGGKLLCVLPLEARRETESVSE